MWRRRGARADEERLRGARLQPREGSRGVADDPRGDHVAIDRDVRRAAGGEAPVRGISPVHGLVAAAKANQLSWSQVYMIMQDFSDTDGLREITDTVVREAVYIELENEYGLE